MSSKQIKAKTVIFFISKKKMEKPNEIALKSKSFVTDLGIPLCPPVQFLKIKLGTLNLSSY